MMAVVLLISTKAHDMFVHPDHPLHEEGIDGATLFVGKKFESQIQRSQSNYRDIPEW